MNKWGKGFHRTSLYNNTRTYYENGLQIYRPEDGLTVAQRRDFLSPEFFDAGCLQEKCSVTSAHNSCSAAVSGDAAVKESPQETKLFAKAFASFDPFTVNGIPMTCAGVKGASQNSYVGWATVNDGNTKGDGATGASSLLWYQEAKEKGKGANVANCS